MPGRALVTTARLALRPMIRADAPALRRLVTRPEIGSMLFVFPPDWTLSAAETFIADWRWRGALRFRLAITARDTGAFLGSIGIGEGEEPPIFYFIDPAVAGRGIASEAVSGFVAWVAARFRPVALHAAVFTDNPASVRVLEKAGFRRSGEGMVRSAARLEPAAVWEYRLGFT